MSSLSRAPVSVAIPTIGRVQLLQQCLASIASCDVRPLEVLIIDQSGDAAIDRLARESADLDVEGRSLAPARALPARNWRFHWPEPIGS